MDHSMPCCWTLSLYDLWLFCKIYEELPGNRYMSNSPATDRKLLVLQHIDWERPGRLLLDLAQILFVELHIVEIWREPAPDIADYDALILLGGPSGGGEEDKFPFLGEEKRLLQAWLALDRPCLGFCLGHQLLADAFKAEVSPNFMTSAGFVEGYLTHEGREHPLFRGVDVSIPLFKRHGRTIQTPVPHNFILLATSRECVVEAFTIKGRPHIIGLRCNNYAAHPDDIGRWIENEMNLPGTPFLENDSGSALLQHAKESLGKNERTFTLLMQNFIALIDRQV